LNIHTDRHTFAFIYKKIYIYGTLELLSESDKSV
jgi:hypothetical protein